MKAATPPMATCTSCHVHQQAFAEARCRPCHVDLKGYKPETAFRHEGNWLAAHGALAKPSAESCAACHDQTYCTSCHSPATTPARLETIFPERVDRSFIHRGDYVSRHMIEAGADPASCRRCHGSGYCDSCHAANGLSKTAAGPLNRPESHGPGWLGGAQRHAREARRDISACAGCHDQGAAAICVDCHARRAARSSGINPHPRKFLSTHDRGRHREQRDVPGLPPLTAQRRLTSARARSTSAGPFAAHGGAAERGGVVQHLDDEPLRPLDVEGSCAVAVRPRAGHDASPARVEVALPRVHVLGARDEEAEVVRASPRPAWPRRGGARRRRRAGAGRRSPDRAARRPRTRAPARRSPPRRRGRGRAARRGAGPARAGSGRGHVRIANRTRGAGAGVVDLVAVAVAVAICRTRRIVGSLDRSGRRIEVERATSAFGQTLNALAERVEELAPDPAERAVRHRDHDVAGPGGRGDRGDHLVHGREGARAAGRRRRARR